MRYYRGKTKRIFLTAVAAVLFGLLSLTTLEAQPQQMNLPRPAGLSERDRNILERETQLTMIERERRRAVKSDPQLAYAQIREDFRRLQVLNNDVMRAVSSGAALNYKYISDSAREIRKRAMRLKLNLVFPEAEGESEPNALKAADSSALKPSLIALDGLIFSFATNPVFKEVKVVDARLGVKARHDLDGIIELSDRVRKNAERMSKTAGN